MESKSGHFKVGNDPSLDMRGDTLETQVKETARALVVKLLRFHIHDWLAIVGLIIIDVVLNIINPFYRYVGETMIGDYMFPFKDNTVPVWAVPVIALLIPIAIFLVYFLVKKDVVDLHHAILGLLFSVLITAVITDAVKDAVGRPRPNFFWRCFPDGIAVYDNVTKEVICHGDALVIKEGHKSFPSGHTSWCFAGLGFFSLYIAGKLQIFDRRGHVGKTAIVLLPILGALLVGLSRVDDYWHHWQDVFTGALIGLTMAFLCYHQFFPSIHLEIGRKTHCDAHTHEKAPFLFGFQIFGRKPPSDWPPSDNGQLRDDMDNLGRGDIRLV